MKWLNLKLLRHLLNTLNNYKMDAIQAYINTLEIQLKTMPNGYVKDTVLICKDLAEGIKAIYENNSNGINKPTN
jgi:hypothetical protein